MRGAVAHFRFEIGREVTIKRLERPGTVTGLMREAGADMYRVVWWNEGERKHEWLYEYEITGETK